MEGLKTLEKQVLVKAPPESVWKAWTTIEGVKRFFAPDARLEIKLGGPYEILFDLDAPHGSQGSERCKVLSFIPGEMLSFTWNAPPLFPNSRSKIAQWVVLAFEPVKQSHTLVRMTELGWEEGEEGEAVYRYFDKAWDLVLSRLAYSFENGPVDWRSPWRPK